MIGVKISFLLLIIQLQDNLLLNYHTQFFYQQPITQTSQNLANQIKFVFQTHYNTPTCMRSTNYQCVNCQIEFELEQQYMIHYKSQHHRYNIKRKLIGLPPLSLADYQLQYQDDKTSKQSSQQELHCEICGKKFMSLGTYKQHIKSKRHKENRQKIKAPQKMIMSKSSSSSDFSIIGGQRAITCIFCRQVSNPEHLKTHHNFPPFQHECIDQAGLIEHIQKKVSEGYCLFCDAHFGCEQSARQHMLDLGHTKLNIDNFGEYEKYYLWKIQESSSESDQQLTHQQKIQSESSMFIDLNNPTLADLEQKRLNRIKLTDTGAIINGRQVGYRQYKKYYKQYLDRPMENQRAKYQPALEQDKQIWKHHQMKAIDRPPKINQVINFR